MTFKIPYHKSIGLTLSLLGLLLFVNKGFAQLSADFTVNQNSGCVALPNVQFTDQSSGNITSWSWQFGNGNTSSLQNPTSSYPTVGSYTVTLTVSNGTTSSTVTKTNFINVYANPVADFNFNPVGGCSPLAVRFNNTSNAPAGVASYSWDFGDGSPAGSGANPQHTYAVAGNFSPSLEIVDVNGCRDTEVKSSGISVTNSPQADFSAANPVACAAPHTVNFSNNSQGSNLSYLWRFGDGNTSTQINPSHTYSNFGTYTVTLEVSDPNCRDTLIQQNYVRIEATNADFDFAKAVYCLEDTIFFNNQSTGANLFNWDFGDGTSSTQFEPSKQYSSPGTYPVRLQIFAGGNCTDELVDTVEVFELVADFITDSTFNCRNDLARFYASANSPAEFIWSLGTNTEPDSLNGDTVQQIQGDFGIFSDTLIAVNDSGCVDTVVKVDNREVDFLLARIAANSVIVDDDTMKGCLPLNYDFADSSLGTYPIIKRDWDFDLNRTSNQLSASNIDFPNRQAYRTTLLIENSKGCTAFDEVYVVGGEKQIPAFTFFPDSICPGDSLTILDQSTVQSFIDTFKYIFLSSNNRLQTIVDTPGIKTSFPPETGLYNINLQITDNGCDTLLETTDSVYLKGPVAVPTFFSSCSTRTMINFRANASGFTRFYWDFGDGSPLDSVNLNPSHQYGSGSTFRVELILLNDTNGCDTAKFELFVPVGTLPPLQISPDTLNFCLGSTVRIYNADSSTYVRNDWTFDGQSIGNLRSFVRTFNARGTYPILLQTEDVLGCTYQVRDTIYISQPEAKIGSEILQSCAPMVVDFIDSSTTDTTIQSWLWTFGNGDSSFVARDTVQYPLNANPDVFLKIENVFGCKDSVLIPKFLESRQLQVDFRFGNVNICAGDSITFRNTSSGLNPTYRWFFNDDTLSSQANFLNRTFSEAGIYTVQLEATDENGCILKDSLANLVRVDSVPVADFIADSVFAPCPPLPANFQDLSSGSPTQWRWNLDQTDNSISIVQNPFKNYTLPGSFNISLWVSTPNGCQDSITKNAYINLNGPLAEIASSSSSICIGDTIQFSAVNTTGAQNYFWDFGDGKNATGTSVSHVYDTVGTIFPSLIIDDGNNCRVGIVDTIQVNGVQADFELAEDTLCVPASLAITNRSLGANSQVWNWGDGTLSSDPNPSKSYASPGQYTITFSVSSTEGCRDTIIKTFTAAPNARLDVIQDTSLCEGDTVQIEASGAELYNWSLPSFASQINDSTVLAFPSVDTTIQLIGNNLFNCSDTANIGLQIVQEPLVPFFTDTTIIIGEELSLAAFGSSQYNYLWTPPDGLSCNTCPNPIFGPLSTTRYTLKVTDPFNCYEIDRDYLIEVLEQFSLDVPQVFSPNGDGVNDVIFAKGWGLKELLSFKIFNRFGEVVFESQDFDQGWDGTYRGEDQNIETYVYTVEALTFGGEVIRKKGNISLIR